MRHCVFVCLSVFFSFLTRIETLFTVILNVVSITYTSISSALLGELLNVAKDKLAPLVAAHADWKLTNDVVSFGANDDNAPAAKPTKKAGVAFAGSLRCRFVFCSLWFLTCDLWLDLGKLLVNG